VSDPGSGTAPGISPRHAVDAMFAADAASTSHGIEIVSVELGTAELSMVVRPDMVNGLAVCHGAMIFMLADSAMACASNSHNQVALAASADIEFMSPARLGERLTARAVDRSGGRRTAVHDVEVVGPDGRLVALFRGRTVRTGGEIVAAPQPAIPAEGSIPPNG
jgi:acyl-CoA thioesterase